MKRLLFLSIFVLTLARLATGATNSFVNNGNFNSPPSTYPIIDATNVTILGRFEVDTQVTGSQLTGLFTFTPFDFSDMLNFTNKSTLVCNGGFIFNDSPIGSGTAARSANFFNANVGTIQANGDTLLGTNVFFNFFINPFGFGPTVSISATNVINNGLVDVSENGLLTVDGQSIDMTRGKLIIEGLQLIGAQIGGVFEDYWGLGRQTNQLSAFSFTLPSPSAFAIVTNTSYQTTFAQISPANAKAFANVVQINASNTATQVVFVGNTNTNITTDVRFEGFGFGVATPVVRLQSILTNSFGTVITNSFFLSDTFGSQTNFQLFTNTITTALVPLQAPTNYTISTVDIFGFTNLPVGNTTFDPSLFAAVGAITNQFTALGVELDPTTFIPDPNLPGQNLTNIPGRIVVNADNYLNLTLTHITGPNYLRITSTNHFVGSANAQISSPNMDINLGSTNGQLNITNLIAPFLPDLVGTVGIYSARWTNVDKTGFTNSYHVLMVDARLAATALPLLQNLKLRATNVTISDQINIASNLLINATSLTITSNANNQFTPYGQLNLLSPNLVWSANLPVLQNVTNFGLITVPNTVYFAEIGQSPYFTTNFTSNYLTFVNHGSILTSGNTTWSAYFENTGVPLTPGSPYVISNSSLLFSTNFLAPTTNEALIYSAFGPISILATNALLANGSFVTAPGDISFNTSTLVISNHSILAGGTLNFNVTSNLTDTGTSNFWSVTDGINLLVKPTIGDLLGTTITNFCPAGFEITNIWAGADRGVTPMGFLNNAAVGHMIIDGGDVDSTFAFVGLDPTNAYAIYVDQLELKDAATNTITVSNSQFFSAFDIATNVTVYFADAVLGQSDISEKLNGANGGRLIWVPSYAGIFSSTNLVYPAGVTNKFNRALVISTDIDSNGNGTANAFDATPIFTASMVNLKVAITNVPPQTPAISWFALANATNFLYYRTNLTSTNWTVVTNFVQPFPSANVTKLDRGRTNSTGFYKVQIDPIQP